MGSGSDCCWMVVGGALICRFAPVSFMSEFRPKDAVGSLWGSFDELVSINLRQAAARNCNCRSRGLGCVDRRRIGWSGSELPAAGGADHVVGFSLQAGADVLDQKPDAGLAADDAGRAGRSTGPGTAKRTASMRFIHSRQRASAGKSASSGSKSRLSDCFARLAIVTTRIVGALGDR